MVGELKTMMQEVDAVKKEREVLEKELKDKTFDMSECHEAFFPLHCCISRMSIHVVRRWYLVFCLWFFCLVQECVLFLRFAKLLGVVAFQLTPK